MLDKNTWNHLNVCKKKSSGSFKNVINKMETKLIQSTCLQIMYIYICVNKI